jgi:hypothetical protein
LWVVGLAANARVSAIKPNELRRLLTDLEASGRRRASDMGDFRDPFVARLGALGIESTYRVKAKAGSEGMVLVQAGTYGGWGWDGPKIDEWLGDFFASKQGTNKVAKLGRAQATERHLVIVLDSFSPAGMGHPASPQHPSRSWGCRVPVAVLHPAGASYPLVAAFGLWGDMGQSSLGA